ncbi:MAG: hypothetical protein ACI4CT_05420 [Lachnospiraceae bacterium]
MKGKQNCIRKVFITIPFMILLLGLLVTKASATIQRYGNVSCGYYGWKANGNNRCEFTTSEEKVKVATEETKALFDGDTGSIVSKNSDVYLYIDLGENAGNATGVTLTMKNGASINGNWAVYGGNTLSTSPSDWTTLQTCSSSTLQSGKSMTINFSDQYRYILIGGADKMFNSWVKTWIYFSEITIQYADVRCGHYGWSSNGNNRCEFTTSEDRIIQATASLRTLFDKNTSTGISAKKDNYLYMDLGADYKDVINLSFTAKTGAAITGNWAIWEGDSLTTDTSKWVRLASFGKDTVKAGDTVNLTLDGNHRFLLIGGSDKMFDCWVRCWDQFSEIDLTYSNAKGIRTGYYGWAAEGSNATQWATKSATTASIHKATENLFDGNTNTSMSVGKDTYLYLDMGTDTVSIKGATLTMKSGAKVTGNWAIYGGNQLSKSESDWTKLASFGTSTIAAGASKEVTFDSNYRYLLIGGSDRFLDSWVHSWDQLSELELHGVGKIVPETMAFQHPGILYTEQDMLTMKQMVKDQVEPWYSTYLELQSTVKSYGTIDVSKYDVTSISNETCGGYNQVRLAATKAYDLALMYYLTDDVSYAAKSREIMMKYASIFNGIGVAGDANSVYNTNIDSGVIALKFCSAAEILRHYYSGWRATDSNSLIQMFKRCNNGCAVSIYQLLSNHSALADYDMDNINHGHAAILREGSMAYAVFAEDEWLYNLVKSDYVLDCSADYTGSKKKPDKSKGANGYSLKFNYNSTTGQCKESDRDYAHANVNLASFITVAQIAWSQGDNSLYECHNRLLLKAAEFAARYNLGYDEAVYETTFPWDHHSSKGITTYDRGKLIENNFAAVYNYYKFASNANVNDDTYLSKYCNHPYYAWDRYAYDSPGYAALLYSTEERKDDYEKNVQILNNTPTIIKKNLSYRLSSTNPIYGEYATAFIAGASRDYSKLRLKGTNAIAAFPYTMLENITKVNVEYASTNKGTLEIWASNYTGSLYGQPEAYSSGGANNGKRGTKLATISLDNTGSISKFKTTSLVNNIYDTEGKTGGTVTGNYMIYVVYKGADSDASTNLLRLQFS